MGQPIHFYIFQVSYVPLLDFVCQKTKLYLFNYVADTLRETCAIHFSALI